MKVTKQNPPIVYAYDHEPLAILKFHPSYISVAMQRRTVKLKYTSVPGRVNVKLKFPIKLGSPTFLWTTSLLHFAPTSLPSTRDSRSGTE